MEKSRDAFRTISEVAGWLDVPTHVLRFWESRFSQIKPVKRAGGRRYYRPSDMALIGGIKRLLHDDGMTIRGVQKMLREQGIKHVASFSPPLHPDDEIEETAPDVIEGTAVAVEAPARPISIPAPAARATHAAETVPIDAREEALPPDTSDDDQPDMFPEPDPSPESIPEPTSPAEAPLFAHRAPQTDAPEDAAPKKPRPSIPATPDVPATDPEDEEDSAVPQMSVGTRLLTIPAERLKGRADQLRPIAERLRALCARIGE